MAGLYLHIPFCKQACHYCDFHFSTNQQNRQELIEALSKELLLQQHYLGGEPIATIYFGGGTPSILNHDELHLLFTRIRSSFNILPDAEITLEANPDDLSAEKLATLRQLGVNRLSIGIESFDDAVLKFMNRAHRADEAVAAMDLARKAGFDNITIDLMYSIPGQSLEDWKKNIRKALELTPQHISAYSLTIEKRTAFGKWYKEGKLIPVEENLSAEEFETLMTELSAAGYDHYEISNFGLPGYHSRHNSAYWEQQKYLGVGPSAHSYDGDTRQFNINNNPAYIRALAEDRIPMEREILTRENKINEYIFTTLRTARGSDLTKLMTQYNFDLLGNNREYIGQLLDQKLATLDNGVLVLSTAGKLVADKVASDLFIDSD